MRAPPSSLIVLQQKESPIWGFRCVWGGCRIWAGSELLRQRSRFVRRSRFGCPAGSTRSAVGAGFCWFNASGGWSRVRSCERGLPLLELRAGFARRPDALWPILTTVGAALFAVVAPPCALLAASALASSSTSSVEQACDRRDGQIPCRRIRSRA